MKINAQIAQIGSLTDVAKWITNIVTRFRRTVDGHLGFGDGSDPDNMFGVWASYTTNASANTEDAITHNLGVVPVGYLVFSQDKAASLYKSTSAWTTTQIFLKCSTASVAVKIFIMAPSNVDL